MSTAQKLVVVLVLALCPPAFSTYLLVRDNRALVEQQTLNDFQATAKIAAARTDAFLDKSEIALRTLAIRPDVSQSSPLDSEIAFGQTYILDASLRNVFGISAQHQVFASLAWDHGRPAAVSPIYLESLVNGTAMKGLASDTNISDRLPSATPDIPSVAVITPIGSENNGWRGHLVGILSLGELQLAMSNIEVRQHVRLIIVDGQGRVLAHPDWDKVYRGESLASLPPVQAVLRGEIGTVEYDGEDGSRWLAAYAPTSAVGWGVVVAQPAETLSAKVQESLVRNVVNLGLAFLLAGAIAALFIRRITRPLRELAQRSAAVMGENQTAGTDQRGVVSDEVQQVTNALELLHSNWSRSVDEQVQLKDEIQRQAEQLSQLVRRLGSMQESERRELAFDIHDGLAQTIVALNVEFGRTLSIVSVDQVGLRAQLDSVQQILEQVQDEVEVILNESRTPDFTKGLENALASHIASSRGSGGQEIDLEIGSELPTLSHRQQLVIYRIVQEALNNVRKHSGASKVKVEISGEPGTLRAIVEDNGVGFDVTRVFDCDGHLGLLGMRERAGSVGALLQIESSPGCGTQVILTVPVRSDCDGEMGSTERADDTMHSA